MAALYSKLTPRGGGRARYFAFLLIGWVTLVAAQTGSDALTSRPPTDGGAPELSEDQLQYFVANVGDFLYRFGGAIPSAIVVTDGDRLIGSAMLVVHDMSTRKDLSPWLAGVFVKPAFRNAGVATKLIERIEQEASQLNIPRFYLYTDKESRFYSKRGWKVVEGCTYKGLEVTIMAKEVPAANGGCQRLEYSYHPAD